MRNINCGQAFVGPVLHSTFDLFLNAQLLGRRKIISKFLYLCEKLNSRPRQVLRCTSRSYFLHY